MRFSTSVRFVFGASLLVASVGCGASSSDPDAGGTTQDATTADADDTNKTDAGPCVPGADSLVCANSTTVSWCTEDIDFDGKSDGPPKTIEVGCAAFFRDVGAATCETFDDTTTEALCTMDDGGPCGVFLVTGQVTSARCTTNDAVCLLNLDVENYVCTSNTGISCTPSEDFEPFCEDDLLVWRCSNDGDGTGQPHVDDCGALGNGKCDAEEETCYDIEEGGRCNLTEWLCGDGLKCQAKVCVPDPS